ncbi:uncharacterized protein LOC112573404 [Pomacea canaliculata]|uniref:uncharacterized protein LOC112573404 n=1 Tax=Pomacea canaliculata TaxID=400727 RepID=UPI000D7276CE|nr:uncharacterized protein LOC112573404 [Pomacea canaliculata]
MTGLSAVALLMIGAVSVTFSAYLPDYSPGIRARPCRDPVSGQTYQVGEVFKPRDRCESWTCISFRNKTMVEVAGCPQYKRVGCESTLVRLEVDRALSFPECCPEFMCGPDSH